MLSQELDSKPDCISASLQEPESLDAMARQTRVLVATAGPFIKFGIPIVDACVRQKCDYVDCTAETTFIRRVIDAHHASCRKDNIFLVPSCGFDSVPSDLGVFLIANEFKAFGLETGDVAYTMSDVGATDISGGTIASGIEFAETTNPIELDEILENPYYLAPPKISPKRPTAVWFDYDKRVKMYRTYYFMELFNTRYVQRSSALLGYGSSFWYTEGYGLNYYLVALIYRLFLNIGKFLVTFRFFRRFLANIVPQGRGPSSSVNKTGYYKIKFAGQSECGTMEAMSEVYGNVDAYASTAVMVAECAMLLAFEKDKLLKGGTTGNFAAPQGGVLTAAVAFGMKLVESLKTTGMTFKVNQL